MSQGFVKMFPVTPLKVGVVPLCPCSVIWLVLVEVMQSSLTALKGRQPFVHRQIEVSSIGLGDVRQRQHLEV